MMTFCSVKVIIELTINQFSAKNKQNGKKTNVNIEKQNIFSKLHSGLQVKKYKGNKKYWVFAVLK